MRRLSRRVQLILFLAAVFVPCGVLIGLSTRLASQDRELRGKRRADERRVLVERARDSLLAVLERIRAGETTTALAPGQKYHHPETVFVAWSVDGKLVLPWDPDRDPAVSRGREEIAAFEPVLRACESKKQAACYRELLSETHTPYQLAYTRWTLAQWLESSGDAAGAAAVLRELLQADPAFTDRDGIPLALHAARALAQQGDADAQVASAVERALAARPWIPPMSSFMTTEVAERLARNGKAGGTAQSLERAAAERVQLLQQAEALQNDFARIGAVLASRVQPAWAPFGDDIWLLNAAGDPQKDATIVAVRGPQVFQHISLPGALRLADAREPDGEPLGEAFPGLKLVLDPHLPDVPDSMVNLQRQMLYVALAAVVLVTMFAAYLLWRDLQREMQALELRSQFVASVSHELKTPLTAIRMFAETLQMGRVPDVATQSEYLGTIVNECERLTRLVDGVLMFSKTEQGKKIFRLRAVQPQTSVQAAARAMEFPLSEQGFHLHLYFEEGLPPIQADEDALEQAVLNLLSNAIKFSGDARDIELALYREKQDVVVRVRDHGIGIAPEEQARIFERFYRVQSPANQSIPGSGLGLTLVAQIARAHGGTVTVESQPGQGSTFFLRFPAEAPAVRKQEALT